MNRLYFSHRWIPLVLWVFLLSGFSLSAREKIPIAVLDFEGKNITQQSAEAVTDILRTELFNTGAFKVIERQRIQKIIEELQFQSSGLTDADQAAQIGRLLNVQKIMVGTVTKLGATYIINTRIVDVQTGLVALAEAAECRGGEDELPRAVTELAYKIYYKVGLEGAVIRVNQEEVYIDLGQADGIKLGQAFDVIRRGEVITDLEGRVIGSSQEVIGRVVVTKVQDRFSIAAIQSRKDFIHKGDLVRPAEGKADEPAVSKPPKPVQPKKEDKKEDDDKKPEVPLIF